MEIVAHAAELPEPSGKKKNNILMTMHKVELLLKNKFHSFKSMQKSDFSVLLMAYK